jgi:hypothetical protein
MDITIYAKEVVEKFAFIAMGNPIFSERDTPIQILPSRTYAQVASPHPLNDHPLRSLLLAPEIPTEPDPVDDLEEMIIRQLRPRNMSLLFSNTSELDPESLLSMDTVMTRLRRQLRNSTLRLSQAQPDARDRLEMDRMMRRVRQERRNDQTTTRWNRDEEEDPFAQRNRRRNEQFERQVMSLMQNRRTNIGDR